ncbi:DUF6573 family protein [Streptomyces sp. NBC_01601]|uniref:DUF6573 family protein n=1 Tax=Streptomyces sp. NBC_01601 TaxID=2975892 RepID=UPI002E2C7471|nr:DUF6573 family protein [Streptomyces sp. NBC_01601]
MDDEYGPVVASFTRAEAFEDGTFIEVSAATASAAGIEMPLIITAGARREFVAGDDGDEDGRLRLVLSAVARAIERAPADEVCFVVPAGELPSGEAPTGADQLIAITEPGDTGELVLTLMLPHEM